jgi:hypothetical protein
MTILASSAARFLVQAAAVHDTVIMRQVPPVRSWFEWVVFVASGISTILLLFLVTGLVVAMFAIRRSVQRAHEALDTRIAEFGRRVDSFNDLLGKVHRRAETVVEVGGLAMDGIAWGAKKIGDRRRRRRKSRGGNVVASEEQRGTPAADTRSDKPAAPEARAHDEHDSPYADPRDSRG